MKFKLRLLQQVFAEKGQSSINTPQLSAAEYFQGQGSSTSSVSNLGFPQPQFQLDVPDFLKKN